MRPLRTRFAPSPTGDLHFGGAWCALASWLIARRSGGAFVLRVEDVDVGRVVEGSEARILEDLRWLGLEWDEGPDRGGPFASYRQSERAREHERALADLAARGLAYPCDCSRKEIAAAASAPHAGEELRYPGTCRDADPKRPMKRAPALRLRVPDGLEPVAFVDAVRGPQREDVASAAGDFVLQRGDGAVSYQLACAFDDAAMEIDLVVRGDDLLASTARQLLLMRLLGFERAPRYAHVPLVVGADGSRLSKRSQAITVRSLRARGVSPEAIVSELARGLGLHQGGDAPLAALATAGPVELSPVSSPWRVPGSWEEA